MSVGLIKTFLYILLVPILLVEDVCCGSASGKSIYRLDKANEGALSVPLLSMSEAFFVLVHCNTIFSTQKLCVMKTGP